MIIAVKESEFRVKKDMIQLTDDLDKKATSVKGDIIGKLSAIREKA
jgi:hypothetical protein